MTDGLQVFGAIGTTDSEIKRITTFPGNEGNRTPKNTAWTANAGFQYDFSITGALGGMLRLDYEHRGKKYWQLDNVQVQKPLELIDVRTGVEVDKWGFYIWGRNLTDERYYADYNPSLFSGLPFDIGFRAQPRSFGVEGRFTF